LQDLPAIVDVVAPNVDCIVPVSAYDIDDEVFNGVTVGGVAVVVAVGVTAEPAKQASTKFKEKSEYANKKEHK